MPTFNNGELGGSIRTKINNVINRTERVMLLDDVTQLASLVYTADSQWTVSAGMQVHCVKEGFAYEVLASGASNFDIQPGAVKLDVLPGPDGAYNFRAMLPVANGTTDDYPLLAKLLDKPGGGTGIYVSGPEIRFPIGRYFMGQTINLRKAVTLRGPGGFPGNGWAELRFAADTSGLVINRFNTDVDGVIDPTSTASDFSTIEGLYITSAGGTDRTKHGIVMRARGTIRAVQVSGFPGDGIHIQAGAGIGGSSEGNANYWFVQNVNCQLNKGNGFYVNGDDANAGTAINLDCASNGRYGIWDSSFLGNTYIGCHAASNGVATVADNSSIQSSFVSYGGNRYAAHWNATEAQLVATTPGTDDNVWILDGVGDVHPTIPLWTAGRAEGTYFVAFGYRNDNANAASVFLGCYSEGGSCGNVFQGPCLVLGGQLGNQYAGDWIRAGSTGTPNSRQYSTNQGGMSVSLTDGTAFETWVGTGDTANETWRFKRTANGGLQLDNANSGFRIPLRVTGISDSRPWKLNVTDVLIGGVLVAAGTAAPTSGTYARGDYVRNSSPSVGQPKGWICTVAGTPGTWVSEGNL